MLLAGVDCGSDLLEELDPDRAQQCTQPGLHCLLVFLVPPPFLLHCVLAALTSLLTFSPPLQLITLLQTRCGSFFLETWKPPPREGDIMSQIRKRDFFTSCIVNLP